MRKIDRCPCCDGAGGESWPALIAPFIAEYVLDAPVSGCRLRQCPSCGLRYFDQRFEDAEMAKLYSAYRGADYFEARHRHEFWYSQRHNASPASNSQEVETRKKFLLQFILEQVDPGQLRRVLDFGGDSGQLLPEGLGEERHVFELSDAQPVPGVRKLQGESELQPGSYDLVVLSHVLEHTPEPRDLLRKVVALLRPGGWLYVEVPWERYSLACLGQGKVHGNYLRWLAGHPRLLHLLDFYSTACRVAVEAVPPFGFPKLHEHINFFHEPSLAKAGEKAGLETVECRRRRLPREAHGSAVLSAMFRRPA